MSLIVAGYDLGMPYREVYHLQIPTRPEPGVYRVGQQSFFAANWGHTAGLHGVVEPYTFPFDIMPLADCADLAAHVITSTAQLETWSRKPQQVGGVAQVVTITQAAGARCMQRRDFWSE